VSRDLVHDASTTHEPHTVDRRDVGRDTSPIIRPAGPAAAVVLAAGLASFTLGLLSVLSAASGWVSDALTLSDRVGNLSGLTTAAGIVFFVAWVALAMAWRHADPPVPRVAAAAALLIGLGLLGTFPPFFNLIGD
jgi:hypothetical protein